MGHWCRICGRKLPNERFSEKNIARLRQLTESVNEDIAAKAKLVLEIGLVCPRKKRRLKILAQMRGDLLEKLEETGLIFAHGGE